MSRNRSKVPILWIQKNRVFGTLTLENTTFFYQVAYEVAPFHELNLNPDFSLHDFSGCPFGL